MRESIIKRNQPETGKSIKPAMPEKMTSKISKDAHPILQLQRTIGNQAVMKLLRLSEQKEKRAHDVASEGIAGTAGRLPHLNTIQQSFGSYDVSDVEAHIGEQANNANQALGAVGYTLGNHVAFAGTPDLHTAAHEATHVVQQRGGVQLSGGMGKEGDEYEKHADAVADKVVAGQSTAGLLSRFGRAARKAQATNNYSGGKNPAIQCRPAPKVTWTKEEIKLIQGELIRLGLYRLTADGDLGPSTEIGLVEAFGGDDWRTLTAEIALARLKKATPPAGGKPGEHKFRYGEMFKDGLLDITLGLGFDERGNQGRALTNFVAAMTANKFKEDADLAAKLYKKAGRPLGKSAFGRFFVREDALTYTPPAGTARKISAIVRLVHSPDGSQGKQVAEAFKEGMIQSDVAYYSGHGRYGSGLDFDRNYTFNLLDKDGNIEQKIDNYEVLEGILKAEGKAQGRDAWAQFLWRVSNKRIDVISSNEGNIFLNKENLHPGEFGAKLMYWNLNRTGGKGSPLITGKSGELATQAAAAPERKYRVVVFDGCRSLDYETSIRATPGFDVKSADMLGSSRTLEWGDEGPTLTQFLNRIINMQSAEEIIKNMDAQQHVGTGAKRHVQLGAYHGYGIEENPIVK
jgi:hypothetical protein